MIVVVNLNHIRQGGWYGYQYNDMDVSYQWYLLQKANKRYFIVHPWNPLKSMPSFADAIACLRRELWRERIKCMFGVSAVHDKKFEFLLEALAPAA